MFLIQSLVIALLTTTTLAEIISQNLSKCNSLIYENKFSDGTTRRTLLKDGDFMIQTILPFSSTKDNCNIIKQNGLVSMISLKFAIDKIHKQSKLYGGYRFGYHIDDSCNSIPIAMATGIEIVSQYRSQSVCKVRTCADKTTSTKPITAVVGPYQSFTAIPFASLLGLHKVPIISPSASSRLLSKKDLYKSFFRIIPSDVMQAKAISELLQALDWQYIYAIGSDDNYGKLGISTLKGNADEYGFCVVAEDYIPYMTDTMEDKAKVIMTNLNDHPNAKVVVVFAYNVQIKLILSEAEKAGVERIWLMSDAFQILGHGNLGLTSKSLIGILRIAPKSTPVQGLGKFTEEYIKHSSHCDVFLRKFMEQQFHCEFNQTSVYCPNDTVESIAQKLTGQDASLYGNTVDAVQAVTTALNHLIENKCGYAKNKTECYATMSIAPSDLTAQLYDTNFTSNHNTPFKFDSNGDPAYPFYDIANVQLQNGQYGLVKVGQWDPLNHLQLAIENVSWPLWAGKNIPKSVCSEDCKTGYYVSARTECCWSCEKCLLNTISTTVNAENCTSCPEGHVSTKDRSKCVKYTYMYLTAEDVAGVSTLVINSIGIVLVVLIAIGYYYFKDSNVLKLATRLRHVHHMAFAQVTLSFIYGGILLTGRKKHYCDIAVCCMYLLKTGFAVLLLSKTQRFMSFVGIIQPTLHLPLKWAHMVTMVVLIFIHVILTVVCLQIDPFKLHTQALKDSTSLALDCTPDYTILQISTIVVYPSVLLLTATAIAIRERDRGDSESRFLNFTAIAHCIVSVAYFPTYKYVVGMYRTIIMAFTIDVCAFTYIGCLMLPYLYIAFTGMMKVASPREETSTAEVTVEWHRDRLRSTSREELEMQLTQNR
eukprot:Seg322.6 transcript_id=Seg322.6/GoldUCD/mRNA.D3Y31 product="Metabotropic glutamate receptor 7" protein_id=Seg322.6/GoldUCD/D3Y31